MEGEGILAICRLSRPGWLPGSGEGWEGHHGPNLTRSTHELGAVPKARAETHGRCRLGLGCWLCAHTHLRYPASPQLGGGSAAHCSLRLHHQVPSQEGDKVWCDDSMDQRNDCFSRRPKINCRYIHGS